MLPSKQYAQWVAAGEIVQDPAQQPALDAFDRMHLVLQQPLTSARAESSGSWWPFGKNNSGSADSSTPSHAQGLYLYGGVGRGKTFLMDLFTQTLPPSVGVKRAHFHHLMDGVHQQMRELKHQEDPLDHIAATWAKTTQVLCLDEFFVNDIGDAMILARLLEGLFARGVMLVTTSNIEPDGLYCDGLQRVRFLPAIALLKKHCQVLHLVSDRDHRLERLQAEHLYVVGDETSQQAHLQRLYDSLTAHETQQSQPIVIRQRTLTPMAHADGVAWFTCEALCDGPRAAADYIEIAKLFHTVLIQSVPIMDDVKANRTRRFINLIDELYDRRVNVIVGAAAEPTALYVGDAMTVAFERTESRLLEMRSQEYLATNHIG